MKKLIPLIIAVLFVGSSFAQNNSVKIISKKTNSIINGTTYTIYGDGATKDVKEEFYAVMESQDSMQVAITRREIQFIPNTYDYFCWYLCYTPEPANSIPVWEAADSLWMYQNDTITNFSVYLQPEMNKGQAHFRYTFYPADNTADSAWLDVIFDIVTVGIEKLDETNLQIYPNPVTERLVIEGGFSKDINTVYEIVDMNGRLVKSGKIVAERTDIPLSQSIPANTYVLVLKRSDAIVYQEVFQKAE